MMLKATDYCVLITVNLIKKDGFFSGGGLLTIAGKLRHKDIQN